MRRTPRHHGHTPHDIAGLIHERRQLRDHRALLSVLGGSEGFVKRLGLAHEFEGHRGCVNTAVFNDDGSLIISGSDDKTIKLWDTARRELALSIDSGHRNNVFCALFMPESHDRLIVSCAADGLVRLTRVTPGGYVTSGLAHHDGRAHKLSIEPGSPHTFYSCGEDGVVRLFDLRTDQCSDLITTRSGLNAVAVHPTNVSLLALGGRCPHVKLFDVRWPDRELHRLCPRSEQRSPDSARPIVTCTTFSRDGSRVLSTLNDGNVYSFATPYSSTRHYDRPASPPPPQTRSRRARNRRARGTESASSSAKEGRRRSSSSSSSAQSARAATATPPPTTTTTTTTTATTAPSAATTTTATTHITDAASPTAAPATLGNEVGGASATTVDDAASGPSGEGRGGGGGGSDSGSDNDDATSVEEAILNAYFSSRPLVGSDESSDSGGEGGGGGRGRREGRRGGGRRSGDSDGDGVGEGNGESGSDSEGDGRVPAMYIDEEGNAHFYGADDSDEYVESGFFDGGDSSSDDDDIDSPFFSGLRHRAKRDYAHGGDHVPMTGELCEFEGHINRRTIKGVSFFGPRDNYVVSGSDCGHVFIWNSHTGELVTAMKGDQDVVNCLSAHPLGLPILVTSGIENGVKLWEPIDQGPRDRDELEELVANNKEERQRPEEAIPAAVFLRMLQRHQELAGDDDDGPIPCVQQ